MVAAMVVVTVLAVVPAAPQALTQHLLTAAISPPALALIPLSAFARLTRPLQQRTVKEDRKSTRLNSSHQIISYAVFCLKKKKENAETHVDSCLTSSHIPPLHPHPTLYAQ